MRNAKGCLIEPDDEGLFELLSWDLCGFSRRSFRNWPGQSRPLRRTGARRLFTSFGRA